MQTFSNKPEFDMTLPTVLAAHLHVRGSEAHSFYKLSPRDDVHVDLGGLSTS